MTLRSWFQRASLSAFNWYGAKLGKRVLVIESDDWGAIRTPSAKVYEQLLKQGLVSPKDPFARYDALESEEDLQALCDVLSSFKDHRGRCPVFTTNVIMGNPDFDRIAASGFTEYIWESSEKTFGRYPSHQKSPALFDEAIKKGLFFPQCHGREHVNVAAWMRALKQGNDKFKAAFELGTYAIDHRMVAAFRVHTQADEAVACQAAAEALNLFKIRFGFDSVSFIATNYTWNDTIEKILHQQGVRLLQGSKQQNFPVEGKEKMRSRYHYCGQQNNLGMIYLVRNCLFEPSISPNLNYVEVCMRQIDNAFRWCAPAIVGSHRLNFVGFLNPDNRSQNLAGLHALLKAVLKKYPDVEFHTSVELEKLMNQ